MRNRKTRTVAAACDLITDMAALLDMAGVDGVEQSTLDAVLHDEYQPQALLDFAQSQHRQRGERLQFRPMINGFLGVAA